MSHSGNPAQGSVEADNSSNDSSDRDSAAGESRGNNQTLLSHLLELRGSLLRVVAGILIAFCIQIPFAGEIYTAVAMPLLGALPEGSSMIATGAAAPFLTPFKLVMATAVFLTIPWILYQVWLFVAPGLYSHERRMATPLVAGSTLLFYAGALFAWFVVMPLFFGFMSRMSPEGVTYLPDIASALDLMLKMFIGFGIAFQVPIAIVLLVYAKAVRTQKLGEWRPYIFLGCFVAGMFLTPPDLVSQTLLAIPMYALFELGLLIAKRIEQPVSDDQS